MAKPGEAAEPAQKPAKPAAGEAAEPAQKPAPAKVAISYFDPDSFKPVEGPDVAFYELETEAEVKHGIKKKEGHQHEYELQIAKEMLVGLKIGELTAAISLRPEEEVSAQLPVRARKAETQTATITVRVEEVEESVRTAKGQEQTKPVQHGTVSAKPIAVRSVEGPKKPPAEQKTRSADIKEGLAVLEVEPEYVYELNVTPAGTYAGSRPHLPVLMPVHSARNADMHVVFEPCKRTLTLLFVDSCGKRMERASFFIGSSKHTANEKGECELEVGSLGKTLQIWSREYDFSPSEIPVGESLAQAVVVTVAKPDEMAVRLLDENGKPLANRKVYIRSKKTGERHERTTNEEGRVQLSVPKGQYDVAADAPPGLEVPAQVINVP